MQCRDKASKLSSVKLLAGESAQTAPVDTHPQRMSLCKVAHCTFNYTSLPSLWNFTAEQIHSIHHKYLFPPPQQTHEFPTQKSLISQMTSRLLQNITKPPQESKESEGLTTLTQKWAPWLSPVNLCTPARIPCWLFVVLCLLLGGLEQPCLDLQWIQQTGDQSETWRSCHIPECVFATASPTKRNRSQVLLRKTITKGNWFVIHNLSHLEFDSQPSSHETVWNVRRSM